MPTTCDCLLFTLPGTCINNTGVFMFKKGCFELGATIYPAVIKVSGLWRRFAIPCRSLVNHLLPAFHSQPVHCWTSLPSRHVVHNIVFNGYVCHASDVMSCWLCPVVVGLPACQAQTLQGNKPHLLVLLRGHDDTDCESTPIYLTCYLYTTVCVRVWIMHVCVCVCCVVSVMCVRRSILKE